MRRKKNREINIFGVSFLDVLANTIGGLAFLLVLAVMMIGAIVFAPPLITTERLPDGYHNVEYNVWLGAREGLGKYEWSFGKGERPGGLKLDALTGKLFGTPRLEPSATDNKRFEFLIICRSKVKDYQDQPKKDERKYQLVVHRQKPINTIPLRMLTGAELPAAYVQGAYPLVFAAEGGQPPYTWTVSGNFPPGLSLNPHGRITGQPAEVGKYVFDVTVNTQQGQRKTKTVSLNISKLYPPPPPLKIKTGSLPDARVARQYQLVVAVEGGYPPYRWEYHTDNKPNLRHGITFSLEQGTIQGTPRQPGRLSFPISVIDAAGQRETANFELRIHPPLTEVKILTTKIPEGRAGQQYIFELSAVGGYPPYTWNLSGGTLPGGLKLHRETGRISGKPVEAGTWPVRFTVADAEGHAAQNTFAAEIHILTPLGARKLVIKTRALPILLAGKSANIALSCEGGTVPYQWKIKNDLPEGITLKQGQITGTPLEAGNYPLVLSVRDSGGETASITLSLMVKHMAPYWLALLLMVLLICAVIAVLILARKLFKLKKTLEIPPLKIITESIPNARASCEYSVQLACAGGVPPYRWRKIKGELPPGLELSVEGKIQGCPFEGISVDKTMDVPFTVEVIDSLGNKAEQKL